MAAKKAAEFRIVNRRSGKALQATGLENGLVVEQAEISKSDAQLWYTVENGDMVKVFNKASGKVLDVMANGTVNGTWAQTWEDVDGESQFWKLVTVRPSYRKLLHVMSGKVLDIADMSEEDGAPAQIWDDVNGKPAVEAGCRGGRKNHCDENRKEACGEKDCRQKDGRD